MTISDESAVELLHAMVAVASPCGAEDEVASVILDAMHAAGFEAHRDDVGNVVGEIGAGDRTLMFLGHMDTAPGIVPVNRRGHRLYGRGTVDAKGPLATGIAAAARASAKSRARLIVVGAVQEEGPSFGARYLAPGEPPDLLIIGEPSNWDAVTLGYKGSQRFEVRFSCPSSHTGTPQPTAPELAFRFWQRLVEWCASFAPDATRDFDRLTPKLIAMSSESDGLHSAASLHVGLRLPPSVSLESAREGVGELAKQSVNSLGEVIGAGGSRPSASCRARPVPPNDSATHMDNSRRGVWRTPAPPTDSAYTSGNTSEGGQRRSYSPYGEIEGVSTVSPSPAHGRGGRGVRDYPAAEGGSVFVGRDGRMQYAPTNDEVGDAPRGEIRVYIDFAPGETAVRVERRGPLVSAFLRAIRAEGGEPRFKVKTGTSDWNVVASRWHCPTVAYGPGDSSLDHTPNEHIEIDEYLRGIRVLTRVMEEV